MNKAFVREPEFDGRLFCPLCQTLGVAVGAEALDRHIRPESRAKMQEGAWFCPFARCEVAYFNQLEAVVLVNELRTPVYPKDYDAPICACFGLTYDDVEADVKDGQPTRIRALLAKSKTADAQCAALAADGRSCMSTVQELYMRLRGGQSGE
jgi:Zinc binding domain